MIDELKDRIHAMALLIVWGFGYVGLIPLFDYLISPNILSGIAIAFLVSAITWGLDEVKRLKDQLRQLQRRPVGWMTRIENPHYGLMCEYRAWLTVIKKNSGYEPS